MRLRSGFNDTGGASLVRPVNFEMNEIFEPGFVRLAIYITETGGVD